MCVCPCVHVCVYEKIWYLSDFNIRHAHTYALLVCEYICTQSEDKDIQMQ